MEVDGTASQQSATSTPAPVVELKITQTFGKKVNGTVSLPLSATGLELKQKIAPVIGESNLTSFKVLCVGRFIKNELTLNEQKVKANAKLMVMPDKSEEQKQVLEQKENDQNKLSRLLSVAETLAERQDDSESYYAPTTIDIYNQHGQRMNLLPADKRGLTVGMSLHDKAKQLAKKGSLSDALEVFLQADTEGFSKCSQELMTMVDNYGLLCLDISWTYFKLKRMENLREAAWRLDKAEECLRRTYGNNFERLQLLKGGAGGAELVNFVRLWLLQGIAAYHSGAHSTAQRVLSQAEERLKVLRIGDDELATLLGMGFSAREARVALRACERDQGRAVTYIFNKRQEHEELRERDRKEREERRQKRMWGKTADGQWVDIQILNALAEAGFTKKMIAAGLRQTNNDEISTIALLTETPEVLVAALAKDKPAPKPKKPTWTSEDKVSQITGMGFTVGQARAALVKAKGVVENAAEMLLSGAITEPMDDSSTDNTTSDTTTTTTSTTPDADADAAAIASAVGELEAMADDEGEAAKVPTEEEEREQKEKALQKEVEDELLQAVEDEEPDADAHLDVSLEEEFAILTEYKQLLHAAMSN